MEISKNPTQSGEQDLPSFSVKLRLEFFTIDVILHLKITNYHSGSNNSFNFEIRPKLMFKEITRMKITHNLHIFPFAVRATTAMIRATKATFMMEKRSLQNSKNLIPTQTTAFRQL